MGAHSELAVSSKSSLGWLHKYTNIKRRSWIRSDAHVDVLMPLGVAVCLLPKMKIDGNLDSLYSRLGNK